MVIITINCRIEGEIRSYFKNGKYFSGKSVCIKNVCHEKKYENEILKP
jgi:hypothetical protein